MKTVSADPSPETAVAPATVLVLVGGASSRMGQNKALLSVGGMRLIERVVQAVRPLGDDLLLIANEAGPYTFLELPCVPDRQPDYGPLMGLYSGLAAAKYELALLVACDMPFLSTHLLRHMLDLAAGQDVVIPRTEDGQHPLHAVYRRSTCLPAIAAAIAQDKRRMIAFHDRVRVREIGEEEMRPFDPSGLALLNVNTPEELALAEHVARRAYYDEEEA